ncbi:MAG: sigma-54 dependent transcriptional regulator [Thermogutta sp.]
MTDLRTPKRQETAHTHLRRSGRILVVDDHAASREAMADILRRAGHDVQACGSAAEAIDLLARCFWDVVVTDLNMPGMSGLDLVRHIEKRQIPTRVIMVTAYATVASAVEAMRHGVFDYIEKPFDAGQLERLVAEALRHNQVLRPAETAAPAGAEQNMPVLVGSSRPMQELRRRIEQIAATSETVLILGESGTGKELVARLIHYLSPRAAGPFISVNCPALSAHLMESELFGHEKGAFTGADSDRVGRFELAHRGSLLLDEITEIDTALQAKLLRVLQERAFERVGSSRTLHVDVRVLATTNRDLEKEIAGGRFRQDLYYRLAVLPIHIPPLRERKEDIPELIDHFQKRCAERLGRPVPELDDSAVNRLMEHDWPGNVRELENLVTRVCVLTTEDRVTAEQIGRWLPASPANPRPIDIPVGISLQDMERYLIEATLEKYDGHREKTAKALGIGVRTLTEKLRQYGYPPRAKRFSRTG